MFLFLLDLLLDLQQEVRIPLGDSSPTETKLRWKPAHPLLVIRRASDA
jgi:hypothetical protein